MKTVELRREIQLNEDYDVIVVGGGLAGCTAAAAAAREGAKTLLVEQTDCLGGMATAGLVPTFAFFSDHQKIICCGFAEQILNKIRAGTPHLSTNKMEWIPIDPELLKRIYDDLVSEAGADVLFQTFMTGVEAKDGVVSEIILSNKAGLTAYRAKVFVDCSGDADLAAWAGAEYLLGDESGEVQPVTHCFRLSNIDDYAYRTGTPLHGSNKKSEIFQIIADVKFPLIPDIHICNSLTGPGVVTFNAGHIWDVNNITPVQTSKALMHGRKMAKAFRDALAEYRPADFGNAFVVQTASLLGARESRRIIGDYTLVLDDYLNQRSFHDEICRSCYYVDVHWSKEVATGSDEERAKWDAKSYSLKPGESHGIPYRCLTPKNLVNVLVAGRSISCDRPMQGSTRTMPTCMAMGEGAGAAAAICAATDSPNVHTVDTDYLRKRLREEGAYLP